MPICRLTCNSGATPPTLNIRTGIFKTRRVLASALRAIVSDNAVQSALYFDFAPDYSRSGLGPFVFRFRNRTDRNRFAIAARHAAGCHIMFKPLFTTREAFLATFEKACSRRGIAAGARRQIRGGVFPDLLVPTDSSGAREQRHEPGAQCGDTPPLLTGDPDVLRRVASARGHGRAYMRTTNNSWRELWCECVEEAGSDPAQPPKRVVWGFLRRGDMYAVARVDLPAQGPGMWSVRCLKSALTHVFCCQIGNTESRKHQSGGNHRGLCKRGRVGRPPAASV